MIPGRKDAVAAVLVLACCTLPAVPQAGPGQVPSPGDNPSDPGPLATDLSPALASPEIQHAMRAVADWQLARIANQPSQDWTYSALYDGLLAAARDLNDPRYQAAVEAVGEHFQWTLGPRESHADDQALGKSYLALAAGDRNSPRLAPMRAQFDRILATRQDPTRPTWWWCDALYMAPSAWAGLAQVTGDARYRDYADREWEIASRLLWDEQEHLFYRDLTFFDQREKNGKKIFWARGNGWVLAGLAHLLETLPADHPRRPFYEQQFRQLAARVVSLQGKDGLWRPGLLDQSAYPLPETSGSAFFLYGIAWGVHHGLLPAASYRPALERGWRGLLAHIYADGRLGCVQPIGAAPGAFTADSSYVYGVGAFLQAGAELDQLSRATTTQKARSRPR